MPSSVELAKTLRMLRDADAWKEGIFVADQAGRIARLEDAVRWALQYVVDDMDEHHGCSEDEIAKDPLVMALRDALKG